MLLKNDKLIKEKIIMDIPDFYKEIEILDSIDSTNEYVKKLSSIKNEGYVCISDEQSKGKGRNGRNFISPKQKGIYMSILLKPRLPIHSFLKITACASVAIFEAIKKNYGLEISIKWINDIYIHDKKVGGILCESSLVANSTSVDYIVLGIGLNIHKNIFTNELSSIAASVEDFTDHYETRNNIIRDILIYFNKYYKEMDTLSFLPIYKKNSIVLHSNITVYENNTSYQAYVENIDEDASLIIRNENGKITKLNSGEISIRK